MTVQSLNSRVIGQLNQFSLLSQWTAESGIHLSLHLWKAMIGNFLIRLIIIHFETKFCKLVSAYKIKKVGQLILFTDFPDKFCCDQIQLAQL